MKHPKIQWRPITSCADQWRGPARPLAVPTPAPCPSSYRGTARLELRALASNNLAQAVGTGLPCLP